MSTFITVFFCLISGIVTRLSLTFANQKWANTYHNTVVYLLLPIITFAITKVISNNIALSLGMVGALSIVRFRNPVKNPLELTIYFLLISYGITFGVDLKYGILLLVSSSILIVSIDKIKNLKFFKDKTLFNLSFNEEENNYLLEFLSKKKIENFINNKFLITALDDKINSKYIYKFGSYEKDIILNLYNEIKDLEEIETSELNF